MSTGTTTSETRTLLRNVTWQQYLELRDGDEYRHRRMTYDCGSLELKSLSRLHSRLKIVIEHCVAAWCTEKRISYQSGGSTTFRREDLERGLEGDNCYYIQNLSVVENRDTEIDLTIDPPPDLILEVDVTSSSIDKMPIYAALGVPEVWRWHDGRLHLCSLDLAGRYVIVSNSIALPGFPVDHATDFVGQRTFADDLSLVDDFRALVRELRQLGGNGA